MEMKNKKTLETPQSINQSNELHLVKNENLKNLLDKNTELKNEVEETEKLINTPLKIGTMEEFFDIVGIMENLKLNTERIDKIENFTNTIDKLQDATDSDEIKKCLNKIKFDFYDEESIKFFNDKILKTRNAQADMDVDELGNKTSKYLSSENMKQISNSILASKYSLTWRFANDFNTNYTNYLYSVLESTYLTRCFVSFTKKLVRDFITNKRIIPLFKLKNGFYLKLIYQIIILHIYVSNSSILLALLSNPDRYNFFLQWHQMLEENLPSEDKQLFYDYLNSCKNKLQIEKNRYNYFYEREWVLTAILVFGSIASAIVLTIYFMEIYVATWFFWFGIVEVILTVAVGICLFLCLKENYNEIKSIDRAIDVYDLEKIKSFKEPEPEKISTFEANKNKIILNNNEINAMEQNNNDIKLGPIDTEKNIDNPPSP